MAKYSISYRVSGTAMSTIETDETKEQLENRLVGEINDDDWDIDLDTIDGVDFDVQEMFLVERQDGKRVWTTYVRATDKRIEA